MEQWYDRHRELHANNDADRTEIQSNADRLKPSVRNRFGSPVSVSDSFLESQIHSYGKVLKSIMRFGVGDVVIGGRAYSG